MPELPPEVADLVTGLSAVDGVQAVVLGGSRARGRGREDSDYDLGLYYDPTAPFQVDAPREVARAHCGPESELTDFGGWGPWVNGGGWLRAGAHRVDLLYRDIDHVRATLVECAEGRYILDYAQQPPFGFFSYTYLGETRWCVPLRDEGGVVADLKTLVDDYPELLRGSVVGRFLGHVEFGLRTAERPAANGDAYVVVGTLARLAMYLSHALLAHNRIFFINDKSVLDDLDAGTSVPVDYSARLRATLGGATDSPVELSDRLAEVRELYDEARALADADPASGPWQH